jgi:nucleotide-binding universal stress UspA family protein
MRKHIIVPTDGTRAAERAVRTAAAMAHATGSAVTLVRAMTPVVLHHAAHRAELVPLAYQRAQEAWHEADHQLRTLAEELRERGLVVRTVVQYGDPAAVVVAQARLHPASLVVMATTPRTGIDRWLLGSRADHVLRHAPVPVLLLGGSTDQRTTEEPWALRTILAVLDGSDADALALKEARHLATASGAYVVRRNIDTMTRRWRANRPSQATPSWAARVSLAWRSLAEASGWGAHDDLADALVRTCIREAPDLVVLPPLHRGWGRALHALVHEAGLPVLVMPRLVPATMPSAGEQKSLVRPLHPLPSA